MTLQQILLEKNVTGRTVIRRSKAPGMYTEVRVEDSKFFYHYEDKESYELTPYMLEVPDILANDWELLVNKWVRV